VPGAFELPLAARFLALSGTVDAVVCVGCCLTDDDVLDEGDAGSEEDASRGPTVAVAVAAAEAAAAATAANAKEGGVVAVAVAEGLMGVGLGTSTPVVHGVLACSVGQARARAGLLPLPPPLQPPPPRAGKSSRRKGSKAGSCSREARKGTDTVSGVAAVAGARVSSRQSANRGVGWGHAAVEMALLRQAALGGTAGQHLPRLGFGQPAAMEAATAAAMAVGTPLPGAGTKAKPKPTAPDTGKKLEPKPKPKPGFGF